MQFHLEKIEDLIEDLKRYTVTSIELFKLEATDSASALVSELISKVVIGIIVLLFAFFLSLGICFYLSDLFGNNYLGFGMVAGFYLLLGIVLIIGRKKLLINPVREKIIQEMMSSKKEQ
ncbi:MAG: phage holin family protein [Prolixibacteraceae bacterium]